MYLSELLDDNLTEKQIWGRKDKKLVRKYRCVGGKRHGRIVAKPQQCFAPPDIAKRVKMKITRKKLAKRMALRSRRTKRTNPASRALKFLNPRPKAKVKKR
jgi:hypothetical protein